MTILHESEVQEIEQPGRYMRWLVDENSLRASNMSVVVIRVLPGEIVRPAHSHPLGEELIYIMSGSGRVMIEDEVGDVKEGQASGKFRQKSVSNIIAFFKFCYLFFGHA